MAKKRRKLVIFVSYAEDDYDGVTKCTNILEAGGQIKCYLANRESDPGQCLSDKIRTAIQQADGFLVFLSPNTNKSHWVNQEIGFALGCSKEIIPVAHSSKHVAAMLQGREFIKLDVCNPATAIAIDGGVADILKAILKLTVK